MTITIWPTVGGDTNAADFTTAFSEMLGDFIASGFTPTATLTDLTLTVAAGVGYCGGKRHSATGPNNITITDGKTTYIYYDPATEDFHLDYDATPPTNALFIATTISSGGKITSFTDRRSVITRLLISKYTIIMWYGAHINIPTGWALCDGTNGTPDLRDRFIIGAGTTYSIGNTGGQATHTLTSGGWGSGYPGTSLARIDGVTSGSITNQPPYYALTYLMKL